MRSASPSGTLARSPRRSSALPVFAGTLAVASVAAASAGRDGELPEVVEGFPSGSADRADFVKAPAAVVRPEAPRPRRRRARHNGPAPQNIPWATRPSPRRRVRALALARCRCSTGRCKSVAPPSAAASQEHVVSVLARLREATGRTPSTENSPAPADEPAPIGRRPVAPRRSVNRSAPTPLRRRPRFRNRGPGARRTDPAADSQDSGGSLIGLAPTGRHDGRSNGTTENRSGSTE